MFKSIKSTEIRETEITYQIKEIEGTDFVKWWANKVVTVNGEIVEHKEYCGVCEKIFFENLDSLELPSSHVWFEKYSNKGWNVIAIHKSDIQDILSGEKTLEDPSVKKNIFFDNIDSDEYDLYLYGKLYSQLLTLDKKLVNLPMVVEFGYTTLLGRMYGCDKIIEKCKELMASDRDTNCKIRSIKGAVADKGGMKICFSLSDDLYTELNGTSLSPYERYVLLFSKVLGIEILSAKKT